MDIDEIMARAAHEGKVKWQDLHPGTQLIARQKMQRVVAALDRAGYAVARKDGDRAEVA